MKGFVVGASLSVAFVLGCVARPFLVPPATAQQAHLQKWEYFCFSEYGEEDVTRSAKAAGLQGWEMAAVVDKSPKPVWCFKRPL